MIDAKAFGLELAGIVKAQLDPISSRLAALEKRVDTLPQPRDGKDADMAEVRQLIEAEIKALGTSTDGVAALVASEVAKRAGDLARAKDGQDGVGLAGALIDRAGELVITLTNGETKNLGPVVGKDGDPGKPGRDGFHLEDFDASVMDDGRTVLLSFDRGDLSYKVELGFPVMLYRGVFKDGQPYEQGDTVTWAGSLWHCDKNTSEKPGDGSKDWTLCAKKGRDGKDGEVKEAKQFRPLTVGVPAKGK
ncbi:hypothetical protein HGP14_30590 [Rhizobium sp. P32RR-XVIII]|uniref:hypothetical protein n=1 Tax=Rhizobium sp. P32RR-XVIII TaxID=2726738 RepID=UPI001456D1E5|nr:hypothetical protein [Rhizobium sp. P32RR-XVIII]NLS07614.1 hypothetical protein [Rhizobium sp. P32RR-XVIII]